MKNILEYLEKTAEDFPNKIAITDEHGQVTFPDLIHHAQRIAGALAHIGRNQPVAILLDRSIACIEAMLAAPYAGCFYAVIDVDSPLNRIQKIVENLCPAAVITNTDLLPLAQQVFQGETIICYEEACQREPDERFLSAARTEMIDTDPLYVLFTSGSSGTPKGVVLSHGSVIRYIDWAAKAFGFDHTTSFGAQTPLYFSMSVTDLYSTLKCGSTYHILPKKYFSAPMQLVEAMNEKKVNTIYWVPSALAIFSNWDVFRYAQLQYMKTVLFAGEVMPPKHLRYWREHLPNCQYANLYGPTESTDICSFYRVHRDFDDSERLPIGTACDNCDVMVVTEDGRRAQPEEPGELLIRGAFLASGYYRDPEKTSNAFIQNPLQNAYPEIVYRTGDLGMMDRSGQLIYLCRKDLQIKRMGYRIELGEIESVINALPGVALSAAIYDSKRDKLSVFYTGPESDTEKVAARLKAKLPGYMYPNRLIYLEQMPLNANGKVHRSRLKEICAGK